MQDLFGRAAGRALPEVRHCCVCTDCYNELLQLPPEHRKCPLCNVHIGDAHSVLQTRRAPNVHGVADAGMNRQQRAPRSSARTRRSACAS